MGETNLGDDKGTLPPPFFTMVIHPFNLLCLLPLSNHLMIIIILFYSRYSAKSNLIEKKIVLKYMYKVRSNQRKVSIPSGRKKSGGSHRNLTSFLWYPAK